MKRDTMFQCLVFVLLIGIGVGMRLATNQWHLWNLAPVTAVALFAGFYLKRTTLALFVPLLVVLVSNLWLDVYQHVGEMFVMAGAFMLPVAFGPVLRKRPGLAPLVGCVAGSSLAFFAISNFSYWIFYSTQYSAATFVECYVRAIPFFRPELLGNLFGSFALFGSYYLATRLGYLPAVDPKPIEARVRAS